jgi:transposase
MSRSKHHRNPHPTDVTDAEWVVVAPYQISMSEDAPQRRRVLRDVFNALRWPVRAGASWRMLGPNRIQR